MSKVWGGVLLVTGFIVCPCHLVITLPLILGVLGGTGLGAFLSDNQGLVYGVATGYFIAGLAVGLYLLNRKKRKPDGAATLAGLDKLGLKRGTTAHVKGRSAKPRSVSPL